MGAEELRGEIRDLVGLIENDRIGRPEQVAEAILLERQVREQQVMIDDDDVCLQRLASRRRDVTAGDFRTTRAEAALAGRSDLCPHRMAVGKTTNLRKIPAPGGECPAPDA